MKLKVCGISDRKTLKFLTEHLHYPEFIGFIVNYPKSKRYVEFEKLKYLLSINKKNSFYVAVLVNPNEEILEKIKNLPFDYYQIYDCNPKKIKFIKEKYKKKIITALTIKEKKDVEEHVNFTPYTDIFLFDSKGYDKSMSFDHRFVENLTLDKELMIAGNIQVDAKLENYEKIADIIDISGGLETSGLKDILKIEIFLNKIKETNDKT
jgi:phosphoribosylanthranilate isomerase